jgi:hypothetical protein
MQEAALAPGLPVADAIGVTGREGRWQGSTTLRGVRGRGCSKIGHVHAQRQSRLLGIGTGAIEFRARCLRARTFDPARRMGIERRGPGPPRGSTVGQGTDRAGLLLRLDVFEADREGRRAGLEALMQEMLLEILTRVLRPLPRANLASWAAFPVGWERPQDRPAGPQSRTNWRCWWPPPAVGW